MELAEMKHHHYHHHDNRCLPQSSASGHHSLACDCDHRSAMKEISREQSLVTQLRAIVLPALQQADEGYKLVSQMFQSILDCSSRAMAELQRHHQSDDDARADDVLVDDKKRVKRSIADGCIRKEEGVSKTKRRRFDKSMSLETPVPHYDGRQWRKYGQKHINRSKHPRSYYRCAYGQEQGCKATKTVQQQDDDSRGADHPMMFTVVYHGQHTCKDSNGTNSGTDDSETNSQSSISTICTDPYGPETSLDGNKPLDKSADLIARNSIYEAVDMTVFETLDLDSWELDAFLRIATRDQN